TSSPRDWSADVCSSDLIFRIPSTEPSISGEGQLAEFYSTQRFNLPKLRAEIVNRIVLGDKVIDHERVWGVRDTPIEVAAIYQVRSEERRVGNGFSARV